MKMLSKFFKAALCFLLVLLLSFCCVGCKVDNEESGEYKTAKIKNSVLESGVVAEQGNRKLYWDNERVALILYDGDKIIWSSLPEEQLKNPVDGGVGMRLESHLAVQYLNNETGMLDTEYSQYSANEMGRIISEKIKNGIKITYCMDTCYIAIPVEYTLKDGYISAKIKTNEIYESGSQIYKITLMPYGISKGANDEGYYFLPDGCGMTVSCRQNAEYSYSGKIYGRDYNITTKYKFNNTADVRLPVFGSFGNGANNCCCIVDGTEGAAEITANIGNKDIGYSYVATTFTLRGSEVVTHSQKWGAVTIDNSYSDIIKDAELSVRFYPMGEESECADIANVYRNYLIEEKNLKKDSDDKLLYLNTVMATSKRKFYFGYPVDETVSLTTYSQVKSMIEDIEKKTGNLPVIRLEGSQDGGIEISKIAGGYKFESKQGDISELRSLCDKYEVYPDFDIVRFSKSGSGISVSKDAAVNATSLKSLQYIIDVSTGSMDSKRNRYVLLSPLKFNTVADKLIGKLKKSEINSVSLSTLGSMNYSDYRFNESYVSAFNSKAVTKINKNLKKNDIKVMYDNANAYAVSEAEYLVNSPCVTSRYSYQYDWFPFYQMVFKGYVSLSGESVNLSDDPIYQILYAAQTGTGIMYSVTGNDMGTDFVSSPYKSLFCRSYDDTSSQIVKSTKMLQEVFNCEKNACLISFEKIADDLYCSEFDNGTSVIVNYGDTELFYENSTVKAKSFIVLKGEKE